MAVHTAHIQAAAQQLRMEHSECAPLEYKWCEWSTFLSMS